MKLKRQMMISIVISAYNEESNLSPLYEQLTAVAAELAQYEFEFVIIDDCSTDKTPEILFNLRENDKRIKIIRLAKNFGSHIAESVGLKFCEGDAAMLMAADLQEPVKTLLPQMIEQWQRGFKVVWGVREHRKKEHFINLCFSKFCYFCMNRLTSVKQPSSGAGVYFLDRLVIDAFNQAPEKNTSVIMLIAWLGFPQTEIFYTKEARYAGKSKWTFSKKINLFIDSLIAFSYTPLRFMSLMGFLVALAGFIYGVDIVRYALAHGASVPGWSSLMIVILMIGGMLMTMMGVLGEYLWRTYDEARGRPRYVIEKNTYLENKLPQKDGREK